jgi:hypothetical protein
MRIHQSIHKYGPHIEAFELRHGITVDTKISFSELHQLIVDDGYASVYRLEPTLDNLNNQVFFTVWNYERLQLLWAKEHGLAENCTMNDIRIAQVRWFQPDVIYDFSGRYRPDFIAKLKKDGVQATYVLWNGVIEQGEVPMLIPGYDMYVSLHRPYIDYWRKMGFESLELQPSIPSDWCELSENPNRSIDILIYGQSNKEFFKERDAIIKKILTLKNKYNISINLQMDNESQEVFGELVDHIERPIYGSELFNTIRDSKIVINKCTDNNLSFKSNMRVFETIGNGALLLTEKGNYPDGLESEVDFLTYSSIAELFDLIDEVLGDWGKWSVFAKSATSRLVERFSKEKQWCVFADNITNRALINI